MEEESKEGRESLSKGGNESISKAKEGKQDALFQMRMDKQVRY